MLFICYIYNYQPLHSMAHFVPYQTFCCKLIQNFVSTWRLVWPIKISSVPKIDAHTNPLLNPFCHWMSVFGRQRSLDLSVKINFKVFGLNILSFFNILIPVIFHDAILPSKSTLNTQLTCLFNSYDKFFL